MAYNNITPKKLVNQAIPTTNTTLYTCPNDSRVFIKDINVANPTSGTIVVSVHLVDSGDTAGSDNALLGSVEIFANDVAQWTGSQIIESGDTIVAVSDTAGACIKISGGVAV